MSGRATPQCQSCLGEGWQYLLNSAFVGNGYLRELCHICGGSGHHAYKPAPGDVAWQKQARQRAEAIRAYLAEHPTANYIDLGAAVRAAEAALPSSRTGGDHG